MYFSSQLLQFRFGVGISLFSFVRRIVVVVPSPWTLLGSRGKHASVLERPTHKGLKVQFLSFCSCLCKGDATCSFHLKVPTLAVVLDIGAVNCI